MKSKFEQLIKNKVDNFEFDYDPKEWDRLEKKLKTNMPKPKGPNYLLYMGVACIAIITGIVLYNNRPQPDSIQSAPKTGQTAPANPQMIEKTSPQEIKQDQNTVESSKSSVVNQTSKLNSNKFPELENTGLFQPTTLINTLSIEKPKENLITPINNYASNDTKINFSIIQSENEGCTPFTVEFKGGKEPINATYTWDFGDGTTYVGFSTNHTYIQAGNFRPSLTVNYANNSSTFSSNINAKEAPVSIMSWTSEENTNIYTFTSNSSNAIGTEWFLNNQFVSNNEKFTKEFFKNDNSNIKLITKNYNGCTDTLSENITIKINFNFKPMPNAFSPDGDGKNDEFGPVADDFSNVDYHFVIYDKLGTIVFETNNPSKKWDGINQRTNKIASTTPDVFVWKIVIKDQYNNTHTKTGSVTLIFK